MSGKPGQAPKWLEGAGFKSKNDRGFLGLLKFLDILDSSGRPTQNYTALRQPTWKVELAGLVREAYSAVFTALPDAYQRSRDQLIDQFRALDGSASTNMAGLMVTTFEKVCEVSEFSGKTTAAPKTTSTPPKPADDPPVPEVPSPLSVQINISLEIPATEKSEVYDSLFKAMALHLRDLMTPTPKA